MQRLIKFRVWYDNNMTVLPNMFIGVNEIGFSDTHYVDLNEDDKENAVVMQYTGLHDKNGVEIYEGDIVNKQYHNLDVTDGIGVVEMGEGSDSDGWANGEWLGWKAGDSSLLDVASSCEVIGNIYQNKDLLK